MVPYHAIELPQSLLRTNHSNTALKPTTMKFSLATLLLVAISATAAQGEYVAPTTNYDRCLTPSEADDIATAISNGIDVDLFPDKVASDQSGFWEMEYHGTYKILRNTQDTINTSYLLYQCGLPVPFNETELAQFDSVFPVPYDGGIVITATTQIPNVEILGRRKQISAFAGKSFRIIPYLGICL